MIFTERVHSLCFHYSLSKSWIPSSPLHHTRQCKLASPLPLSPTPFQTYQHVNYPNNNPAVTRRVSPSMKSSKRRKPPSSSPTPNESHEDKQSSIKRQPARINVDNSTLSVRKQISLVKKYAQHQQQPSTKPLVRTSFRKKKDEDDFRKKRFLDNSIPDGRYEYDNDPLMFVDGYNIIGAWPRLRKHRDRDNLERARTLLLEDVSEFGALRGWECVVVFDAMLSEFTPGQKEEIYDSGIQIIYTGNETADTFIERNVFLNCQKGQRQIWAATSDLVQARVSGAMGAHVMSASLFIQELKKIKVETKDLINTTDGDAYRSKMLMSNVDADTLKKLYQLRDR